MPVYPLSVFSGVHGPEEAWQLEMPVRRHVSLAWEWHFCNRSRDCRRWKVGEVVLPCCSFTCMTQCAELNFIPKPDLAQVGQGGFGLHSNAPSRHMFVYRFLKIACGTQLNGRTHTCCLTLLRSRCTGGLASWCSHRSSSSTYPHRQPLCLAYLCVTPGQAG
jgi:hypothetical protein